MTTIDLRCPFDYASVPRGERPEKHSGQNLSVKNDKGGDYYFSAFQRWGGLNKKLLEKTKQGSLMMLFGGGQQTRFNQDQLRKKEIEAWNVDFDPEAVAPRILIDLNHLPDEFLQTGTGSILERLSRCRENLASTLHPAADQLISLLKSRPIGTCVLSHILLYVRAEKHKSLLHLLADSLPPDGNLIVADKVPFQYKTPGVPPTNRGMDAVESLIRERSDLTSAHTYLGPSLRGKAYKKFNGKMFGPEDIVEWVLSRKGGITIEEFPTSSIKHENVPKILMDGAFMTPHAEEIYWLRKK